MINNLYIKYKLLLRFSISIRVTWAQILDFAGFLRWHSMYSLCCPAASIEYIVRLWKSMHSQRDLLDLPLIPLCFAPFRSSQGSLVCMSVTMRSQCNSGSFRVFCKFMRKRVMRLDVCFACASHVLTCNRSLWYRVTWCTWHQVLCGYACTRVYILT